MSLQLDKEKAERNLAVILDRLHSDADLALLSEYRKLFKKEISLFRRSWAAAWLFMYYDQKEIPNSRAPGSVKSRQKLNEKKRVREEKHSTPSASGDIDNTLPEEESKRLFISIGKNRRLYPREIIALFSAKTSASREDIGIIRILDNYSFVQVRDTKSDEIIKTLNGIRFRGRTLAVNYAKPRNNENEDDGENRTQK